jgi:PAS domain-containing protein
MESAVRSSIGLGAMFLLLSLGLLYAMLRPTMNRLHQAMNALASPRRGPLRRSARRLQSGYQRARSRFRDEVDNLADLTYALAKHPGRNCMPCRGNTPPPSRPRPTQLEQERDFVAGLLDTAPVLILTYGRDGRIRLANVHAVSHQWPSDRRIGWGVPSGVVHGRDSSGTTIARSCSWIVMGDVFHSESSLIRPDGVERDVVWFHSSLEDRDGERAFLSVGLDVTDYRQVERSLMLLAEHDSVTGLYNRRAFKRELDALLSQRHAGRR